MCSPKSLNFSEPQFPHLWNGDNDRFRQVKSSTQDSTVSKWAKWDLNSGTSKHRGPVLKFALQLREDEKSRRRVHSHSVRVTTVQNVNRFVKHIKLYAKESCFDGADFKTLGLSAYPKIRLSKAMGEIERLLTKSISSFSWVHSRTGAATRPCVSRAL